MKRVFVFFLYILVVCFFWASFSVAAENPAVFSSAKNSRVMPDLLGGDDYAEEWDEDFTSQVPFSDPLEPMNRVFFTFNDRLYNWLLKPVADSYSQIFPYEVRTGFANFFTNIGAPVRLANSILQGDADKSQVIVQRFLLNSTAGIFGLVDVARLDFDLQPQQADFGQTFSRWGVGFGPYICAPFLGPSSVRDLVGTGVGAAVSPMQYLYDDLAVRGACYSMEIVNSVSLHPDLYDDLHKMAFDPYVAARQAYYDHRSQQLKGEDKRESE